MSFDLQLEGARALVAGGTRGVGAAVVQSLMDAGVQVVAAALSPPKHPVAGAHYIAADLTTAEGANSTADYVRGRLGGRVPKQLRRQPLPLPPGSNLSPIIEGSRIY